MDSILNFQVGAASCKKFKWRKTISCAASEVASIDLIAAAAFYEAGARSILNDQPIDIQTLLLARTTLHWWDSKWSDLD